MTGPDQGPSGELSPREIVGSEFAEVAVSFDHAGHSTRLRLEDLRTGRVRFLDALELETIVWITEGHLQALLDPSADRWNDESES